MPQQEPPPRKEHRLPPDEEVLRSLRREHVKGEPPRLEVSSQVFAGPYPSVDRRSLLPSPPGPSALALHPDHHCVVAFRVELVERVSMVKGSPPTTIGKGGVFADPTADNQAHAKIGLVDEHGEVVSVTLYKNQLRRFKHNLAKEVNAALGAGEATWLVPPPEGRS